MESFTLDKRDRCEIRYGRQYCYSEWYYWGRWVLAGIAVLIMFLVLVSCCFTARRRRRRGVSPYYGTGWMAPGVGKYQNNQDFYSNQQHNSHPMHTQPPQQYGGFAPNPPPAYGEQQPQYTGTTFNPNDGYYGQQQNYGGPGGGPGGVQSPPHTYQPENTYPPPPNPPGGYK